MSGSSQYLGAWDSFWRDAPPGGGAVFWDAAPEVTAAVHLPLFAPHFAPGLPLVDLGCGNGTQTRFLARHYDPVIGVDVSAVAIERAEAERAEAERFEVGGAGEAERAREESGPSGGVRSGPADFRRVDAADAGEMAGLHAELGDTNVYVRGVLHQAAPEVRSLIVANTAVLLGERGRLFVVELAAAAKEVLQGLARLPQGPPAKVAAIFEHGIAPAEMADEEIPAMVRRHGLEIVADGRAPLITTERRPDGSTLELPTHWLIARGAPAP